MKLNTGIIFALFLFYVQSRATTAAVQEIGTCTVTNYERGMDDYSEFLKVTCSGNKVFYYHAFDAVFVTNNPSDMNSYSQVLDYAYVNNKRVIFDWYTAPSGLNEFIWLKVE
jgi:hypothetical protein